jgi:hypothetical protein
MISVLDYSIDFGHSGLVTVEPERPQAPRVRPFSDNQRYRSDLPPLEAGPGDHTKLELREDGTIRRSKADRRLHGSPPVPDEPGGLNPQKGYP